MKWTRLRRASKNLAASLEAGEIHVTFRAVDGFSPIKRAEYSVDASDWKYVEPVGQLSDAKTENYDFKVTPEAAKDGGASSEHVVVVRVYDRYDNMGAAKILVRGSSELLDQRGKSLVHSLRRFL